MLNEYIKNSFPGGKYPDNIDEYLKLDDAYLWGKIKDDEKNNIYAERLINRKIMTMVYETPIHSKLNDEKIYNLIKSDLLDKFGSKNLLFDSADKMTHKIPMKHGIDDERAIPILLSYSDEPSTIGIESGIISKIDDRINIMRIYAKEDIADEAKAFVKKRMKDMSDKA